MCWGYIVVLFFEIVGVNLLKEKIFFLNMCKFWVSRFNVSYVFIVIDFVY